MGASSNSRAPTWACYFACIGISSHSRMVICTTKVLLFASNAAITNSFGLTSQTRSVIGRALLVVYDFHVSVPLLNATSALLISRKASLGSLQIWCWLLRMFPERIWACRFYLLPGSQQSPSQTFLGRSHQSSGLRRLFFKS